MKLVPIQLSWHAAATTSTLFHCTASLSPNDFSSHPLIIVHSVLSHITCFILCYLESCHMNEILEFQQPYFWSSLSQVSISHFQNCIPINKRHTSQEWSWETRHTSILSVSKQDSESFKKMRKDKMLRCENSKYFYSQTNMKKPLP